MHYHNEIIFVAIINIAWFQLLNNQYNSKYQSCIIYENAVKGIHIDTRALIQYKYVVLPV